MNHHTTFTRYITLGLLTALAGAVWIIALSEQPSLYS